MGSVFRKTVTKPLPPGAEFVERTETTKVRLPDGTTTTVRTPIRLARWRDGKGKPRTAPLTESGDRIRIESGTWYAKLRDGNGIVVEVPTGCHTEDAARQVLADLERKAERVRAGLITPAEARTAEHLATPIGEHIAAYLQSLEASGSVPMHRHNV